MRKLKRKRTPLEALRSRVSTRTFSGEKLPKKHRDVVLEYVNSLHPLLEKMGGKDRTRAEYHEFRLNSYLVQGVIDTVALIGNKEISRMGLMNCGYLFQKVVTFCETYDIRTIWIAGRWLTKQLEVEIMSSKSKKKKMSRNEAILCMIAFGKQGKRGIIDYVAEYLHHAKRRKPSSEQFFETVYGNPLNLNFDKKMKKVFEAVRWGPSAVNRQPWRILKIENEYHFFTFPSSKFYSNLDIGIAIANFETACEELQIEGKFYRDENPQLGDRDENPQLGVYPSLGCIYFMTWGHGNKI